MYHASYASYIICIMHHIHHASYASCNKYILHPKVKHQKVQILLCDSIEPSTVSDSTFTSYQFPLILMCQGSLPVTAGKNPLQLVN